MINYVDLMLRQLVLDEVDAGVAVSFDAPDKEWRTRKPADKDALNIFLVDLRENRQLRTNDSVRSYLDGEVFDEPAPRRVDCHFLVSAWSHAKPGPATTPVLDEHALLHRFASAIANADPFRASHVFDSSPLPANFPVTLIDAVLPVTLLPVDGFAKLPELWGTMGQDQPLKPVIYLVVTVPLHLDTVASGPMVTTRVARFVFSGSAVPGEELLEIGGQVLDRSAAPPTPATPVPGIWVDLLDAAGGSRLQLAQSDALGRFTFSNLAAGGYQLRALAPGFAAQQQPITVPSGDGHYDLVFA